MQDLAWDPWTWEVFCGQFTAGTISGYLRPGARWEPEGLTIARTAPDQIRVLWGVARGPTSNREFLIYSFAYPLKTS